jgi:hypothetical protein
VPELGERRTLCNWVRDEDGLMIDEVRFQELRASLPDNIVENIDKARQARDGRMPMIKAGLGYEELLAATIVDGTAIASSSTEAFLAPALMIPANYLQPGGIPGRVLRLQARGRVTTLTTAATMTFKVGAALTNVIPTTTWCVSGAITMDTTIQTATMWEVEAHVVVRSVGSAGTVFAMGDSSMSAAALTIANQQAVYLGSAGSATPATAAVDMTVNQFLSLTGKWSLTTAYSIQSHQLLLEALN